MAVTVEEKLGEDERARRGGLMRPYYESEGITLYHGDNAAILPTLPAGSIDLVFTSPPYNLGNTTGSKGHPDRFGHYRKSSGIAGRGGQGKWKVPDLARGYGEHDDNMPHEKYVAWQNAILLLLWPLLSDTGAIFYNHKPRILDGYLITPLDYVPSELRPFVRQEIIWKRSGGINFTNTAYLPMHERIIVIARRGFRLRDKGASGVGDVWEVHQERDNPHPAPFPIGLPARAIETTTARVILDPFAGSLTTMRAAVNAGRAGIGIDLSEAYLRMGVERLRQSVLPLGGAA